MFYRSILPCSSLLRGSIVHRIRIPAILTQHAARSFSIVLHRPDCAVPSHHHPPNTSSPSVSTSSPVIVLFGWLGAKPHNVYKYAELYLSMGYSVITFLPNPFLSLLPGFSEREFAKLAKLMASIHTPDNANTTANTTVNTTVNTNINTNPKTTETSSSPSTSSSTSSYPPFLFHLMSNMGAYNYALFLNFLRRHHSNTLMKSPINQIKYKNNIDIVESNTSDSSSNTASNYAPSNTSSSVSPSSYHAKVSALSLDSSTFFPSPSNPALEPPLIRSIIGSLFDSSPSELTVDVFTRGYSGFLTGFLFHKSNYTHPYLSPPLRQLARALHHFPYFKRRIQLLHSILYYSQPLHTNQLYMHSLADPLIPVEQIRLFAQTNAMRLNPSQTMIQMKTPEVWKDNTDVVRAEAALLASSTDSSSSPSPRVFLYDFVDSDHVAHYRSHPEQYKSLVAQYLNYCIQHGDQAQKAGKLSPISAEEAKQQVQLWDKIHQ